MKKSIGIFIAGCTAMIMMTSTTCTEEAVGGTPQPASQELSESSVKIVNGGIDFEKMDLEKAKKQAKKSGKLIFIDCYTSWCGPCKRMAATTFKDDEVGKFFNDNFVNLKVDIEKDPDGEGIAQRYRVRAFPTLLVIDGDGKLIKQTVGFQTKDKLMAFAKSVV